MKGFIFTTDALMAITLIIIATVIVFSQDTKTMSESRDFTQVNALSDDGLKIASNMKFRQINETLRNDIIADTTLTENDLDENIAYIIGALWAEDTPESLGYAEELTKTYIGRQIPDGYSYGLYIDNNEIYADPKTDYSILSASRRMISGIREGSPSKGTSTRISINNILSKKTSKYLFFGGFVGEGNITKTIELPELLDTVSEVYIEMDAGSNFTLKINSNYAGYYTIGSFVPQYSNNWTVDPSYNSLFTTGTNTIRLNFDDEQNSYIGGGYTKITYNTSQMDTSMIKFENGNASERYNFPGIIGFINLYSSFYVPGALNSMRISLHLDNPYATYLYIGNTKVYENSTNQTEYIEINDSVLSSLLSYASLSEDTIPLRLGVTNMSGLSKGGDIVLITDVSGSMGYEMNTTDSGTPRNCDDPDIYDNTSERISIAKCIDKEFTDTILDNEDQKIGLVSYSTTTTDTLYLTDNNATLKNRIDTYTATLSTCISCGIKSSADMLKTTVNITTAIQNGTSWYYNDSYRDTEPPLDTSGRKWYDPSYSLESEWSTGDAVFGTAGGSFPLTTTMAAGSTDGVVAYADLWDDNSSTTPVSFESGYNSTANTFGWGAGDDGWDSDNIDGSGPYGYDDLVYYNNASSEVLEIDTGTGAPKRNRCSSRDCSGAYGIQFIISQYLYDIISNNGMAKVSFWYQWESDPSNPFEPGDQVWVKARFTDKDGTIHWLGSDLDTGHSGSDSDPEIYTAENPNTDFSGDYVQNLTNWIGGPGTYYLDLGGKLDANNFNEYGIFRFDNILLEVRNGTSTYYFRKNFTISDINKVGRGFLKVASDDTADIYLNGKLVDADPGPTHDADYWNRVELVDRSHFRQGSNTIAAKLTNSDSIARFDARVETFNTSRTRAMLAMSDGEANVCYPGIFCSISEAKQEAIDFACDAYENYGIIVHAVGFSSYADETTLKGIASCGHGIELSSANAEDLRKVYESIANAIVSYTTQRADITGQYDTITLFEDSYIEYNYTPSSDLSYGEISLTFESDTFAETSGNPGIESPKNGSYWIPPTVKVIDAKATSYSSDYWTSILNMKTESSGWTNVYNLSTYNDKFTRLGDPYIIYMPASGIGINETNYVELDTGTNGTYFTGGSPDSRVIYTIKIKGSASYSEVSTKADGCTWKVEQYNGNNATIKIPKEYSGAKNCEFSSAMLSYDDEDSIDNAAVKLFEQLDVTGDNRIDIAIDDSYIDIRIIKVRDIPWMWGPAIMRLEIWK